VLSGFGVGVGASSRARFWQRGTSARARIEGVGAARPTLVLGLSARTRARARRQTDNIIFSLIRGPPRFHLVQDDVLDDLAGVRQVAGDTRLHILGEPGRVADGTALCGSRKELAVLADDVEGVGGRACQRDLVPTAPQDGRDTREGW
jgi:hypothetical protein